MKKFFALLFLSPLAFVAEFSSNQAISYIKEDLHKITSLDSECVGFYLENQMMLKHTIRLN